jgi:uracil permease
LYGLAGTLSGLVAVGLVYFLMSALVKWQGINLIKRLFPPVVIGPVIMLIGLSLAGTGVSMAKEDWLLAIIALVTAIIVSMFAKGLLKLIPIFTGIIAGYIAATLLGKVDFSEVAAAPWLALPQFVKPEFSWGAILFMIPVAIAPVIEHVGDVYAVSQVAGKDFVKNPGLHRTMLGDGIACCISGFIGGPPVTTYSEVTGAMVLTKVTDPVVIRIAAITGIVFSLVGKISVLLKSIPGSVLGGIMLLLFGMIAATGVNNMVQNRTDMSNTRNLIIVSLILTTGIGGAVLQIGNISMTGIGLSALVGIVLNLILPKTKEHDGMQSTEGE